MSKVLLITGGGRGIGAATARLAVSRGYSVCVNYLKDRDTAEALVKELGGKAIAVAGDVSVEADVLRLFESCDRAFGKLDALVNNAALLQPSPIETMTDEHMLRETLTNFMGPALTAREAIPLLRAAGGGDIVNISSDSVVSPGPHLTFYAAAKAGLEQLSIGLRQELRGEKIRVTILRSGPVADSELHRGWTPEGRDAFYDAMRESGALEKFGEAVEPEVMAQTLIHLLCIPRTAIADTVSLRPI